METILDDVRTTGLVEQLLPQRKVAELRARVNLDIVKAHLEEETGVTDIWAAENVLSVHIVSVFKYAKEKERR